MNRLIAVCSVLAVLLAAGCAKDDIPTTPGGPFLLTRVSIERDVLPVPETTIAKNQSVTARYGIAFTLSPDDEKNRANLRLFVGVYGISANDTLVSIGTFPGRTLTLAAGTNTIRDSLTFTVPAAAATVSIEAFLDSTTFLNPVMSIDRRTWNVQ
jgi:hypothetical protein